MSRWAVLVVLGFSMYAVFYYSFIKNSMSIKWQYLSSKNLEQTILFYFILEVNLMMTLATGGSCNWYYYWSSKDWWNWRRKNIWYVKLQVPLYMFHISLDCFFFRLFLHNTENWISWNTIWPICLTIQFGVTSCFVLVGAVSPVSDVIRIRTGTACTSASILPSLVCLRPFWFFGWLHHQNASQFLRIYSWEMLWTWFHMLLDQENEGWRQREWLVGELTCRYPLMAQMVFERSIPDSVKVPRGFAGVFNSNVNSGTISISNIKVIHPSPMWRKAWTFESLKVEVIKLQWNLKICYRSDCKCKRAHENCRHANKGTNSIVEMRPPYG